MPDKISRLELLQFIKDEINSSQEKPHKFSYSKVLKKYINKADQPGEAKKIIMTFMLMSMNKNSNTPKLTINALNLVPDKQLGWLESVQFKVATGVKTNINPYGYMLELAKKANVELPDEFINATTTTTNDAIWNSLASTIGSPVTDNIMNKESLDDAIAKEESAEEQKDEESEEIVEEAKKKEVSANKTITLKKETLFGAEQVEPIKNNADLGGFKESMSSLGIDTTQKCWTTRLMEKYKDGTPNDRNTIIQSTLELAKILATLNLRDDVTAGTIKGLISGELNKNFGRLQRYSMNLAGINVYGVNRIDVFEAIMTCSGNDALFDEIKKKEGIKDVFEVLTFISTAENYDDLKYIEPSELYKKEIEQILQPANQYIDDNYTGKYEVLFKSFNANLCLLNKPPFVPPPGKYEYKVIENLFGAQMKAELNIEGEDVFKEAQSILVKKAQYFKKPVGKIPENLESIRLTQQTQQHDEEDEDNYYDAKVEGEGEGEEATVESKPEEEEPQKNKSTYNLFTSALQTFSRFISSTKAEKAAHKEKEASTKIPSVVRGNKARKEAAELAASQTIEKTNALQTARSEVENKGTFYKTFYLPFLKYTQRFRAQTDMLKTSEEKISEFFEEKHGNTDIKENLLEKLTQDGQSKRTMERLATILLKTYLIEIKALKSNMHTETKKYNEIDEKIKKVVKNCDMKRLNIDKNLLASARREQKNTELSNSAPGKKSD